MDCPKRNALPGLPDEAMLEILARVPFRSVCRAKCVAKAWRDLIDDPLNRGRLPQTLEGFFFIFHPLSPWEHFFVKYSMTSVPLDIDPCLSFVMKLPEIGSLYFLDSCNGLLLFKRHSKSNPFEVLGYIMCNPATKHWGTVPVCALCPVPKAQLLSYTYLAFNLAVSPHFHLIHFRKWRWDEEASNEEMPISVNTYSSEFGVWSHSQTDWNEYGQLEGWRHRGIPNQQCQLRAFFNGILHLVVFNQRGHQIVAVDIQGRTKWTIKVPAAAEGRRWDGIPLIGQSRGHLHYINQDCDAHDPREVHNNELPIWVLQDYDTHEWVLKGTVSFLRLFGRMTVSTWDFNSVVIHPDRNVVFFQYFNNRLIAYDMDSKEVSVVAMGGEVGEVVPYIPYLSELPALTN